VIVTHRECLPDRRASWTAHLHVCGQSVYVGCGEFPDGRLGEVFVDISRAGSSARTFLKALSLTISLALQHGTPLRTLVDALKGMSDSQPAPVPECPEMGHVEGVVDALAKHLEAAYLAPATGEES
jgi:ribonucleoside-diphosphate reductase alpha chain